MLFAAAACFQSDSGDKYSRRLTHRVRIYIDLEIAAEDGSHHNSVSAGGVLIQAYELVAIGDFLLARLLSMNLIESMEVEQANS